MLRIVVTLGPPQKNALIRTPPAELREFGFPHSLRLVASRTGTCWSFDRALEPERKLGAAVNLSVKSAAGGPVTVRLEPCGSARGSLVDSDGNPIAKPVRELRITMVVTPGPARNNFPNPNDKTSLPSADEYELTSIDPINYEKEPAPDAVGRITLPVLIPARRIALSIQPCSSAARPARRSARSSPSSQARSSSWAISESRSLRDNTTGVSCPLSVVRCIGLTLTLRVSVVRCQLSVAWDLLNPCAFDPSGVRGPWPVASD